MTDNGKSRISWGRSMNAFPTLASALVALAFLLLVLNPLSGEAVAQTRAEPAPYEGIKNITFYLKYNTVATNIADFTATRYFDTDALVAGPGGGTNTTTSLQTNWFLAPELAASVRLEGTMRFYIWMKRTSITGDSRPANFAFTLYDVDRTGTHAGTIFTASTGNIDTDTDWQEYMVTGTLSQDYAIPAGHSIECYFELTGSASNHYEIAYGNTSYKSRLVLGSRDYVRVHDILFYNYQMAEKTLFPTPTEVPNRTIHIRADITDPFGGYDIVLVNLTLTSPDGTVLLSDIGMTKIPGSFKSHHSIYEFIWDYSSAVSGRYNATVTTVDNTGWNYRYPSNPSDDTYRGHLDRRWAYFWIGGAPVDLWVLAIDDSGEPLNGAAVAALRAANPVSEGLTNAAGLVKLMVSPGSYTLTVTWQVVPVGTRAVTVTDEVPATDPVVIQCSVYYPVLHTVDSRDMGLSGATAIITHPNGNRMAPRVTDSGGNITLQQAPVGDYHVSVVWRGVFVYDDTISITSTGVYLLACEVYHLEITVICSRSRPVSDAHVEAHIGDDLYGSGYSGADGRVTVRVPAGDYTLSARFRGQYMLSMVDASGTETATVSADSSATVVLRNYPPAIYRTNMFFIILIMAVLCAIIMYMAMKAGKGKAAARMPPPGNVPPPYPGPQQAPEHPGDGLIEP